MPSLDEKNFPMEYTVRREDGAIVVTAETVQVAVNSDDVCELPARLAGRDPEV